MRQLFVLGLLFAAGCKPAGGPASGDAPGGPKTFTVGLVTDVGGRGDQSFNDSALRGLETWAAGAAFKTRGYAQLPAAERQATIPPELSGIEPLPVKPLVLQSKAQEDYQPNLQLLVDRGCDLTIGVGFMLEGAIETAAVENPNKRFLLIDSPVLDANGVPRALPNVRTVVFREEEGSFLVGALAGLVAKDTLGFVGGMEIPLIKKFEAGFRAGVKATNPHAKVLVGYTGSFDKVAAGKQLGNDFVAKGVEVIFQAAGSDGLGVIQSVKEAHAAGKPVLAVGVDSDQHHLAPDAMLTSMVKRVDLAVYSTIGDLTRGQWQAGDVVMGLKEGGVSFAPVRIDFAGKQQALARVQALRDEVISGHLVVPSNLAALERFVAPPPP